MVSSKLQIHNESFFFLIQKQKREERIKFYTPNYYIYQFKVLVGTWNKLKFYSSFIRICVYIFNDRIWKFVENGIR